MKLILSLIILTSTLAQAEEIYVRKTVANSGVSAAEADKVRELLRKTVTTQGHTLVGVNDKAQWILRAIVSKSENGSYTVKIERNHAGALVGTNRGSDTNLIEATRLATLNLIVAIPAKAPEKSAVINNEVAPAEPEHRQVAAAPAPSETPVPVNPAPVDTGSDTKHSNYIKPWLIAVGPVLSNNLVPVNNQSGTKVGVNLAYNQGLSEYWNLQIMYDSSFNTVATGSTNVSSLNAGVLYFFADRLSDTALWVSATIGYGGGNRTSDSTGIGSGAIGVDFLRTEKATFSVYLRNSTMYADDGRSISDWPNITQLMAGINF